MNTILISVVLLGVLGIAIGLLLGVAGKFFAVEVDERVDQVRECLPGNNCGGCGSVSYTHLTLPTTERV